MRNLKLQESDQFSPNISLGKNDVRNYGDDIEYDIYKYTILGKHESLIDGLPITNDDKNVYAYRQKIKDDNILWKYYIRGSHDGHLYNPLGMHQEGFSTLFNAKTGKDTYPFIRVNKKVFDTYLMFLKTKNKAYYESAERENF